MRKTVVPILLCLCCFLCLMNASASLDWFSLSGSSGTVIQQGGFKCWGSVRYPGAPRAETYLFSNQISGVIYDKDAVVRVQFTTDAQNWKQRGTQVYIESQEKPIKVKIRYREGGILYVDIPLAQLGGPGLKAIRPEILNEGSDKPYITFIVDIGSKPISIKEFGCLQFNCAELLLPEDYFGPIPELGLNAKETLLLALNRGLTIIDVEQQNIVRQILQARLNQRSTEIGYQNQIETVAPAGILSKTPPEPKATANPEVVEETTTAEYVEPVEPQPTPVSLELTAPNPEEPEKIHLVDSGKKDGQRFFRVVPSNVMKIDYCLTSKVEYCLIPSLDWIELELGPDKELTVKVINSDQYLVVRDADTEEVSPIYTIKKGSEQSE